MDARVRRWLGRAVLAVPVLLVLVLGWTHRWTTDDGFIYFRIVSQVVHGHGPVFNAGERVEAYTSPLWLAILVLGDVVLPVRLEWIAALGGIGLSAAGVALAMLGARRLSARPGDDRLVVPAGVLVAIAPFASWVWLTSGLETGLTWAWLGACLLVLARWAEAERPPGAAACVLLGLGWLVRPELVLLSALFLLVVVVGDRALTTWRTMVRTIAIAVALPLAYQVFRMGYFGLMTANTALAKEGSSLAVSRGVDYAADFARPYRLWLPLLVVVLGGYVPLVLRIASRQRLVVGAFLVGAVATAGYVVLIGGDYLHGRMFFPSLFALCAPVAVVPLERRFAGMAAAGLWALVAMASFRPPTGLYADTFTPTSFGRVTADDPGWGGGRDAIGWLGDAPLYLETDPFHPDRALVAPFEARKGLADPTLVAAGIGRVGYLLGPDVRVQDTLGLADPIGSHFEVASDRSGKVGHEKPMPPAWIAALVAAPGQELRPKDLGAAMREAYPLIPLRRGPAFDRQVDQVRLLLACDVLQELDASVSDPMGPGRFVHNLLHAPAHTSLRFSADPKVAVDQLCP